jgi:hypothetical protein
MFELRMKWFPGKQIQAIKEGERMQNEGDEESDIKCI